MLGPSKKVFKIKITSIWIKLVVEIQWKYKCNEKRRGFTFLAIGVKLVNDIFLRIKDGR